MARGRSRLVDFGVYCVLRSVGCVLQALSPELATHLVEALAALACRLDRRHRGVARDNVRQAFPGRYTEEQLDRLVRDVYCHFGRVALELLLIPRKLGRRTWPRFIDASELGKLEDAYRLGRPMLLVTAHYGSWELAAYCLGLVGAHAHLVARPLDNPYLEASMREFRERTGNRVLRKNGDFGRMRQVLAAGGTLCTLADQDAGARGMFVEFFGRPASTHKAIAHLMQHSGACIAVVGVQNTGGLLRYALRVTDVIRPEDYAGQADATYAITRRVNAAVERLVCYDPRQYLWLHQRWKHQPPQARQAAA